VPKVRDHFSDQGGQFLVMEFVPGDDFSQLFRQQYGGFPVNDVLGWADQILDALDYLHTHQPPIIHRDIKPENLRLTPRGQVVLIDFGLAKETELSKSLPGFSLLYTSPEQLEGQGTGPESDLYSLGATLYHFLTGCAPVDAMARTLGLARTQTDPLKPLGTILPALDPQVAGVIHQAFAIERTHRWSSALEMRTALRAVMPPGLLTGRFQVPVGVGSTGRQLAQTGSYSPTVIPASQTSGGYSPTIVPVPAVPNNTGASPLISSTSSLTSPAPHPVANQPSVNTSNDLVPASFQSREVEIGLFQRLKRTYGLTTLLGALVGIILLGLVGYSLVKPKPTSPTASQPVSATEVKMVEILQQSIEVLPDNQPPGTLQAEVYAVRRADSIRIHIRTTRPGFLYVIGRDQGKWVTMLTNRPSLKNPDRTINQISTNQVFVFPSKKSIQFRSTDEPRQVFQLLFSPTQIQKPLFLDQLPEYVLSEPDTEAFNRLVKSASQLSPQHSGNAAFVSLQSPDNQSAQPLYFSIIEFTLQ
ncbi:MAG TPA: serine/threonine-protein kinase, partial [Acidobacteriota bacterium]|nr:serine/threonine-protein kinase [Acidobacteriota bacterium]